MRSVFSFCRAVNRHPSSPRRKRLYFIIPISRVRHLVAPHVGVIASVLFFWVLGTFVSGCGPVRYLSTVTVSASRSLAEAKAMGAETRSPYEYWSADTYLRMARELAGHAHFELAVEYGEIAERMAATARDRASRNLSPSSSSPESVPASSPNAFPKSTDGRQTPGDESSESPSVQNSPRGHL